MKISHLDRIFVLPSSRKIEISSLDKVVHGTLPKIEDCPLKILEQIYLYLSFSSIVSIYNCKLYEICFWIMIDLEILRGCWCDLGTSRQSTARIVFWLSIYLAVLGGQLSALAQNKNMKTNRDPITISLSSAMLFCCDWRMTPYCCFVSFAASAFQQCQQFWRNPRSPRYSHLKSEVKL